MNRREKVEKLQTLIANEENLTPTDLLDSWESWAPEPHHTPVETEVTQFVPTTKIHGTAPQNQDRLVEKRLVNIINKLLSGQWNPKQDPVSLNQTPHGDYYVAADGIHRTIAHKYLNYDHIYAEVTKYELAD